MVRLWWPGMTLREQAERLGIRVPVRATLRKYGIDEAEWLNFVAMSEWVCPICERRPNHWNVDHEHVPGWKKMPPDQRKRYVRGVICAHCNWRIIHSNLTARMARNVAVYLTAYEARRDA